MARTKKQISMAEAAMIEKRTFIQPCYPDMFVEIPKDAKSVGIIPEAAWELFKAMNGPENVFGKLADLGNVNPISPQDLRRALNNGKTT